MYARMRTFFSCTVHASLMFSAKARRLNVLAQKSSHLGVMSLLGVSASRFPPIASSPVLCRDPQPRQHRRLEPEVLPAPLLHGVECLATWLIRLQTHTLLPPLTTLEPSKLQKPPQTSNHVKSSTLFSRLPSSQTSSSSTLPKTSNLPHFTRPTNLPHLNPFKLPALPLLLPLPKLQHQTSNSTNHPMHTKPRTHSVYLKSILGAGFVAGVRASRDSRHTGWSR